jgi:hypothetical protein
MSIVCIFVINLWSLESQYIVQLDLIFIIIIIIIIILFSIIIIYYYVFIISLHVDGANVEVS